MEPDTNPLQPPQTKQAYKEKEKLVDPSYLVSTLLPSPEVDKPILPQSALKPQQLQNRIKQNCGARERRHLLPCSSILHTI